MKRRFPLLVLLTLMAVSVTSGQIRLDIKTMVKDKSRLKVAKAGLIAFLQQSGWAKVVEFGEEYSVWLTNPSRTIASSLVNIELDLELRVASATKTGKLIQTKHVRDTIDLSKVTNLDITETQQMYSAVWQQLSTSGRLELVLTTMGVPDTSRLAAAAGMLKKAINAFRKEIQDRDYTAHQVVEGMLIGAKLERTLKEMVEDVSRSRLDPRSVEPRDPTLQREK